MIKCLTPTMSPTSCSFTNSIDVSISAGFPSFSSVVDIAIGDNIYLLTYNYIISLDSSYIFQKTFDMEFYGNHIAYSINTLWVTGVNNIKKIDLFTGIITTATPTINPKDIVFVEDYVWVASGNNLLKINPATLVVENTYDTGFSISHIAKSGYYVGLTRNGSNTIYLFDINNEIFYPFGISGIGSHTFKDMYDNDNNEIWGTIETGNIYKIDMGTLVATIINNSNGDGFNAVKNGNIITSTNLSTLDVLNPLSWEHHSIGHGDISIYFTTNGDTPTTGSTLYTTTLNFTETTTLKAISAYTGMDNSDVATEIYTKLTLFLMRSGVVKNALGINFVVVKDGNNIICLMLNPVKDMATPNWDKVSTVCYEAGVVKSLILTKESSGSLLCMVQLDGGTTKRFRSKSNGEVWKDVTSEVS